MIIYFSVSNFRSIKDKVTLSFEPENTNELEQYYFIEPISGLKLLKLGLIYGPNGSGKTTILRALGFLRSFVTEPLERKSELLNFKPFLFDELTPNQDSKFEVAFVADGVKYQYEISCNTRSVTDEKLYFYSPNKALVYSRSTDNEKQLSSVKFGNKIKIKRSHKETLEANTLWNNTVLGGFSKTNLESDELKSCIDWFQNTLMDIITPKTSLLSYVSNRLEAETVDKNVIIELLKKADFKINDIVFQKKSEPISEEVIQVMKFLTKDFTSFEDTVKKLESEGEIERREIFFEHTVVNGEDEARYKLPYEDESQGTQRYYQFSGIMYMMIRGNKVFLIDELEASLHPDLLKHFLLIFLVNAKEAQIITNTHYRELLLEKDILRDDVIWFSEKKNDGSMDLYSLSEFDSSVVRNTTSIFNAYKTGKLGAVPALSDYYLNIDGD